MSSEAILGIVRHILTFGGGLLVTKGVVDEGTMTTAVGAAVTLIGAIWSVWAKRASA